MIVYDNYNYESYTNKKKAAKLPLQIHHLPLFTIQTVSAQQINMKVVFSTSLVTVLWLSYAT